MLHCGILIASMYIHMDKRPHPQLCGRNKDNGMSDQNRIYLKLFKIVYTICCASPVLIKDSIAAHV